MITQKFIIFEKTNYLIEHQNEKNSIRCDFTGYGL